MATKIAGHHGRRWVSRPAPRVASAAAGEHEEAGYAVIAVGTFVVLASTLLSPGIEAITQHFEQSGSGQGGALSGLFGGAWGGSLGSPDLLAKMMVTMPAVVVALVAPFGGWLLDRIGRRSVLLAGVVIYGLGGAAGGLLSSPLAMLGSRVVFGLGVAAILLSTTTLIGDYFDGRERRQMLGWQIAAISVVSTVGMFLAAWLVSFSWRWPFAVYAVVLLLLPWAWGTIDEPSEAEKSGPSDAADEADEADEADADDEGESSVPWHTVGLIYAASFFALVVFHLATTQIPGYLDELGYGSPYATAAIVSIIGLVGVPSSILFDKARDRFDNQLILVGVFGLGAVGFAIAGAYQSIWTLCVGLVVFGLLYGMRTPAFNAWLLNVAPPEYRGRLVGGLTAATFFGIFASPLLSNPLKEAVGMPAVILVAAVLQAVFAVAFAYFAVWKPSREGADDPNDSDDAE